MAGNRCVTCNREESDHISLVHPFNDGSLQGNARFRAAETEQVPPAHPFDPVLRQALIDKGVLTPEDLDAARRKIDAITNVVNHGG